jgi:acid phosphatase type 7
MKTVKYILVVLGIILPLSLLAYMFSGHGAFDNIFNYTPTLNDMIIILITAAVLALFVFIDANLKKSFLSVITVLISIVSITLALYFAYIVIIPKYVRKGEAPVIRFINNNRAMQPIRFAAGGDAHIGNKESRTDLTLRIFEAIKKDGYSMFFFLGDICDHGFDDSMWKKALNNVKSVNSRVPMWFVPGNHDTMFGGDKLYRLYATPDRGKPLWTRIDNGAVHFVILDLEWLMGTFSKDEGKWLDEQLASIPRKDWCIVMSHTFFYASGKKRQGWEWYDNKKVIDRLVPFFERYGVDLVMSGHIHQTEVLKKNGVTYAIVGSMGGKLSPKRTYVSPHSVWYQDGLFGFADVSINGKTGTLAIRDSDNRVRFKEEIGNSTQ